MLITTLFKLVCFQMWSLCEMLDSPLLRVPIEERWVQLQIFAWFWNKIENFCEIWTIQTTNRY